MLAILALLAVDLNTNHLLDLLSGRECMRSGTMCVSKQCVTQSQNLTYVRVVVNWNSVGTPIDKCVIQKWTSVLMTARIAVVLVPAIAYHNP